MAKKHLILKTPPPQLLLPPARIKVNHVVNLNGTEVACQYQKPVLILEELIGLRREMENKFASRAWHVAVPITFLADVTFFKVKIKTGSPTRIERLSEAI